jgi:uncharacterized beta-barrel protein YwiB (DUF1934 family)
MKTYNVDSIEEALTLCEQFKTDGKYDWFRGQDKNYRLCSSSARLDEIQRNQANQKFAHFVDWAANTDGLRRLSENADALIAIAQHYHIPTNFVDFTSQPKVATFFATEGAPQQGELACILCLNVQDLESFFERHTYIRPKVEFIQIKVPALWRLEAQSGAFLFCPYDDIEKHYSFDRILFPYSRKHPKLVANDFYPKNKSSLEVLIDQFILTERLREHKTPNQVKVINVQSLPDQIDNDVISSNISIHDSWRTIDQPAWADLQNESYHDSTNEIVISIKTDEAECVLIQLLEVINNQKFIRNQRVSWIVKIDDSMINIKKLSKMIDRLWNGVRKLPYTNQEIAESINYLIKLAIGEIDIRTNYSKESYLQEVEFGSFDASYSRGKVNNINLQSVVREDIGNFIFQKTTNNIDNSNITRLLQCINNPMFLFDFKSFKTLFIKELIPYQVFENRDVLFYSPTRINRFGLP